MKTESIKFARWLLKREGIDLTFDMDDAWEDYFREITPRNFGMVFINFKVAEYFEIDAMWMKQPGREINRVFPRQVAQYCMWTLGYKNDTIRLFYSQNHASVTHSIRTVMNYMTTDRQTNATIREVLKIFG